MRRRSPTSRGSRVPAAWSIAATRSRTSPRTSPIPEAAYLLLHGDLPKRAELEAFQSRTRAVRAIPEPLDLPAGPDPARESPDGRAQDVGERPGPLRPRGERLADRPRRQRPQGRANARPDANRRRRPRADRPGPDAAGPPDRPRLLQQLPLHDLRRGAVRGDAQGVRPLAGPLRRARAERLDLRRPGHGLDALGHLFRDRRGDRHPQGVAPRRGQRGSVEGPGAGRLARQGGVLDPGRPGPQGADHGLRPPGLQDRRPPAPDLEVPLRRRSRPRSATTAGSGSPSRSRRP